MHDVVAHHMSMIAAQAETVPYRIADLLESAQAEFAALSKSARAALSDMRRLLGVLRSTDEPERLPQPGLADLPALVDSAPRRGQGLPGHAGRRLRDPAYESGLVTPGE